MITEPHRAIGKDNAVGLPSARVLENESRSDAKFSGVVCSRGHGAAKRLQGSLMFTVQGGKSVPVHAQEQDETHSRESVEKVVGLLGREG